LSTGGGIGLTVPKATNHLRSTSMTRSGQRRKTYTEFPVLEPVEVFKSVKTARVHR
jgi:hypothetical protein